jgi:hypothetical protein
MGGSGLSKGASKDKVSTDVFPVSVLPLTEGGLLLLGVVLLLRRSAGILDDRDREFPGNTPSFGVEDWLLGVGSPLWEVESLSLTDNSPWPEEEVVGSGSTGDFAPSSFIGDAEKSPSDGSSGGGVKSTDMFRIYGCDEGRGRDRVGKPALVPRTVVAALVNKTCWVRLGEVPTENVIDRVMSWEFPKTRTSLGSVRNGDANDPAEYSGLNALGVSGNV